MGTDPNHSGKTPSPTSSRVQQGNQEITCVGPHERCSEALDGLETLLTSVLEVDHPIDWSLLVDNSDYAVAKPTRPQEEGIPREPCE